MINIIVRDVSKTFQFLIVTFCTIFMFLLTSFSYFVYPGQKKKVVNFPMCLTTIIRKIVSHLDAETIDLIHPK